MKKHNNTSNTITADTLQQIANAVAIRALTTIYTKSGDNATRDMLHDAIRFAHNTETAQGDKGAELVQEVACFLCQYIGKELTDHADNGETDKDGEPVTILRATFRHVNRIIHGNRQRVYKVAFIEDYESEHGEIAVPFMWDIPTYTDYATMTAVIASLNLTENQRAILAKRLKGKSLAEIGEERGISKQAVANTLAKVAKKYTDLYGTPNAKTLARATR